MSEAADGRDDPVLREALDRMAHQIRNPLQAVAMNLEVLRMKVRASDPEFWRELEPFADAVDENVRKLDRRTRMLVALSRRSDEEPFDPVEPGSLLAELVTALRYDRESPAVEVRRPALAVPMRARRGLLLELLLDTLARARATARAPDSGDGGRAADGEGTAVESPARGDRDTSDAGCDSARGSSAGSGAGAGSVSVRVEPGVAELSIVLPMPLRPPVRKVEAWRRLAARAGGRLEAGKGCLRISFPVDPGPGAGDGG